MVAVSSPESARAGPRARRSAAGARARVPAVDPAPGRPAPAPRLARAGSTSGAASPICASCQSISRPRLPSRGQAVGHTLFGYGDDPWAMPGFEPRSRESSPPARHPRRPGRGDGHPRKPDGARCRGAIIGPARRRRCGRGARLCERDRRVPAGGPKIVPLAVDVGASTSARLRHCPAGNRATDVRHTAPPVPDDGDAVADAPARSYSTSRAASASRSSRTTTTRSFTTTATGAPARQQRSDGTSSTSGRWRKILAPACGSGSWLRRRRSSPGWRSSAPSSTARATPCSSARLPSCSKTGTSNARAPHPPHLSRAARRLLRGRRTADRRRGRLPPPARRHGALGDGGARHRRGPVAPARHRSRRLLHDRPQFTLDASPLPAVRFGFALLDEREGATAIRRLAASLPAPQASARDAQQ